MTDTGSGIHADDLERIFERFYRAHNTDPTSPTTRVAWRGIGLTIARSIARTHGGDIIARSTGPGRGATFRLTIPSAS